jgi:hypothetical protein
MAGEMHLDSKHSKVTTTTRVPAPIGKEQGALQMLGMKMISSQATEAGIKRQFDQASEDFFIELNKELEKINLFFIEM